ncbi:MAG: hypothetical protein EOP49_18270 [Sphingobacteriales bacterium]|nr:MAG: hypothetical protein EOP49_18270 [Sphingobacteriales bacterium]
MISIIICSKSPELLQMVSASIDQTIGVPYEIIAIHNPEGKLGICAAYNQGAEKARYKHLCFSHEDIIYHTQCWGQRLLNHLTDPEAGLIGVVGCCVKPKSPSGVWLDNETVDRHSMLQTGRDGRPYLKHWNPLNEERSHVMNLDGLFLACRKKVWEENRFDEENFSNFHGYDVDFSIQVAQRYKNYVVFDILLEHQSDGRSNHYWLDAVVAVEKKWSHVLPLSSLELDEAFLNRLEFKTLETFLKTVIENKCVAIKYLPYYLQMVRRKPNDLDLLRLIRYYFQSSRKNLKKAV